MTESELQTLRDLMVKLLQTSGPSPFFWAVSAAIELSPADDLNKPIIVYNRHVYACRFFDNRAAQLKHESLNKPTQNG